MNREKIYKRLDAVTPYTNTIVAVAAWCALHAYEADAVLECLSERLRAPSTTVARRTALVYVLHELLLTVCSDGTPEEAKQKVLLGVREFFPGAVDEVLGRAQEELSSFVAAVEKALGWWQSMKLFSSAWLESVWSSLARRSVGPSFSLSLQRCAHLMARYEAAKGSGTGASDEARRLLVLLAKVRRRDFPAWREFEVWHESELAQWDGAANEVKREADAHPVSGSFGAETAVRIKTEPGSGAGVSGGAAPPGPRSGDPDEDDELQTTKLDVRAAALYWPGLLHLICAILSFSCPSEFFLSPSLSVRLATMYQPQYNTEAAYGVAQPSGAEGWGQQQQQQLPAVEPAPIPSDEQAVRWSWNVYPVSRVDAAKLHVPLGCMYTPLGQSCPVVGASSDEARCRKCRAFLNPFITYDVGTQSWTCVICGMRNTFSQRYGQVTDFNLPEEMRRGNETVEYHDCRASQHPAPVTYVLIVDTCLESEVELDGLRSCLRMVVSKLPDDACVSFMTFGITIQMHDLSARSPFPRCTVLRGSEEVKVDGLKMLLPDLTPFIVPLQHCRPTINQIIDELARDPWPVPKTQRPLRCTGAVLSAATSLLEVWATGRGSCVLSFLSGACTIGPGMVVNPSREFMIRGHTDIRDGNDNASLWLPSCAFYDNLMQRLVAQGHSLSCFCASLDQLGIAEMKQCVHCSGGLVFNAETWNQQPFRQSMELFFEPHPETGRPNFVLNATFDVLTSPTWRVAGVIGQCVGTGKKAPAGVSFISDKEIGAGGTCQWTTGMIDPRTTFAVYFHTSAPAAGEHIAQSYRYTQFITQYETPGGVRLRVTTLPHRQQDHPTKQELIAAFDQETAAVLMAREAVFKTDLMQLYDVLRWLDTKLVKVVGAFAQRTGEKGAPMQLPPQFVFFPAFMYHLRRSGYLQVFNSSPDESAIIRLQLLKSDVRDSIVQIQPTLYRYRMDAPSEPVSLDSSALQPDCIVLLDTFFEVLLHSGATVAAWRNAGYADMEEYSNFREFLEAPLADAQLLVLSRIPVPRLIDVCQDDPDARILYNRINPSRSYDSVQGAEYGSSGGELVYTDDASLQTFMKHLWKLAASENNRMTFDDIFSPLFFLGGGGASSAYGVRGDAIPSRGGEGSTEAPSRSTEILLVVLASSTFFFGAMLVWWDLLASDGLTGSGIALAISYAVTYYVVFYRPLRTILSATRAQQSVNPSRLENDLTLLIVALPLLSVDPLLDWAMNINHSVVFMVARTAMLCFLADGKEQRATRLYRNWLAVHLDECAGAAGRLLGVPPVAEDAQKAEQYNKNAPLTSRVVLQPPSTEVLVPPLLQGRPVTRPLVVPAANPSKANGMARRTPNEGVQKNLVLGAFHILKSELNEVEEVAVENIETLSMNSCFSCPSLFLPPSFHLSGSTLSSQRTAANSQQHSLSVPAFVSPPFRRLFRDYFSFFFLFVCFILFLFASNIIIIIRN
eukprot:gene6646-4765_t